MQPEECSPCHGTGEDLDKHNGAGGVCDYCDGSGTVQSCPNAADAAHEAAYDVAAREAMAAESVSDARPETHWLTSRELAAIERRRQLEEEESTRRIRRLLDE